MKCMNPVMLTGIIVLVTSAPTLAGGSDIYNEACSSCHDNGIAGAPKVGDKAAWTSRIAAGMDALYAAGIDGKPGTAMLAKGGYASLSDADIRAAVDYMVANSK